jgi:2'-5' RNA ligase
MANTTKSVRKQSKTLIKIDKCKLNITVNFYFEIVKGNTNQWENWFARVTLTAVPLTRARRGDFKHNR